MHLLYCTGGSAENMLAHYNKRRINLSVTSATVVGKATVWTVAKILNFSQQIFGELWSVISGITYSLFKLLMSAYWYVILIHFCVDHHWQKQEFCSVEHSS